LSLASSGPSSKGVLQVELQLACFGVSDLVNHSAVLAAENLLPRYEDASKTSPGQDPDRPYQSCGWLSRLNEGWMFDVMDWKRKKRQACGMFS
jgi:hypothetical protein